MWRGLSQGGERNKTPYCDYFTIESLRCQLVILVSFVYLPHRAANCTPRLWRVAGLLSARAVMQSQTSTIALILKCVFTTTV